MKAEVIKINKQTIYFFSVRVRVACPAYEHYEVVTVKGKILKINKGQKAGDGSSVVLPVWVLQNEKIKKIIESAKERLIADAISIALTAMEKEEVKEIELTEKLNTWVSKAKPSEVLLEWALGKGWYNHSLSVPEWAAAVRGTWDHAWSD